jgi:hypothetical protein
MDSALYARMALVDDDLSMTPSQSTNKLYRGGIILLFAALNFYASFHSILAYVTLTTYRNAI